MKKIIATMFLAATAAMALGPTRVGPVSQYGRLVANGGKLSGSCPSYADKAVQVKGMSLFWSTGAMEASDFYSESGVYRLVDEMNVEVIRFALGVANEFANGRGYHDGPVGIARQKALLRSVIRAAIEKDVYVIVDWHTEGDNGYTSEAEELFEWVAKEYGKYNNIIYEVWNEPIGGGIMSTVASHANSIIAKIRAAGSDNLVLVGSPDYSKHPEECANSGIQDSKKNFGCTFHFYAASHPASGEISSNASKAMAAGVPVFATEWGAVNYDGNGGPSESESQKWIDWMKQNNVSWANWSASAQNETSAAFTSQYLTSPLQYSTSGEMVKKWMNSGSYTSCNLENGTTDKMSGFSAGVANGASTFIIDDMEDGDRYSYLGGAWSAFEDKNDGGLTTISNPKITDDFGKETYDVLLPAEDGNTSKYMVGIKDIKLGLGSLTYAPNAALSLNLKKDTTVYADFSKCKAIKYKYKGAGHTFRVETTAITNWNHYRVVKMESAEWREVTITLDELKQETWEGGTLELPKFETSQRLAWIVSTDKKGAVQPKYNYLYVDDLTCEGVEVKAVSAKENVDPASSSSGTTPVNPASSSSNPTSSPAATSSSATQIQTVTVVDLDDVEDGDEVLASGGTWYAYTDKEPGGLSSIKNVYDETLPGYVVVFPGTTDPTNGTAGFVGITGIAWSQGTYGEDPFVAIGANAKADTSLGIDLSACEALSYRYKGNTHTFKVQDGQVADWAYHQNVSQTSAEWKTVVISWDELIQPAWGEAVDLNKANIKKFAWEVIGAKGVPSYVPELDYLYIDDFKCVNLPKKDGIKSARVASNSIKLGVIGNNLSVNLDKAGAVRVQIFDMMGHVVENIGASMSAGSNTVSLEKMSKGSYVVRVIRGSEVKSARVTLR